MLATAGLPVRAQTPFVAVLAELRTCSSASACQPRYGTDPLIPILTIKKRVDEVNVLFIATDQHGKFVRNLNQADFTILDDHKPPQSIVNFRRETDLPLRTGTAGGYQRLGAQPLRFRTGSRGQLSAAHPAANFDKAFVMGFSSTARSTQDFTDNVHLLETGVQQPAQRRRNRALRRHLSGLQRKTDKERCDHPVRRASSWSAMAKTIRAK